MLLLLQGVPRQLPCLDFFAMPRTRLALVITFSAYYSSFRGARWFTVTWVFLVVSKRWHHPQYKASIWCMPTIFSPRYYLLCLRSWIWKSKYPRLSLLPSLSYQL